MSLLLLEFDALLKIATFLTLTEVQRLSATNTKLWHNIGENALFWQEYLRTRYGYYRIDTGGGKSIYAFRDHYQQLIQQLEYDIKSSGIDFSISSKVVAKHLHLLDGLRYTALNFCELDSDSIWDMEGHSGALLMDRFWVVVSGWPREEHFDNTALCLDLGHHNRINSDILGDPTHYDDSLDARHKQIQPILVHNIPPLPIHRFIYGFTVTSMCLPGELDYLYSSSDTTAAAPSNYSKRLILFGGLTLGGYRGDVNGLYTLEVSFFNDETNEEISDIDAFSCTNPITARAKWSSNLTPNPAPRQSVNADVLIPNTRGYHTANIIMLNGGRRSLVVFGGLHEHRPCNSLEIYDINTDKWVYNGSNNASINACSSSQLNYAVAGVSPSHRFGHSSTLVGNKLYICGGSDGNDLIRNGNELKDLYILEFCNEHNRLTWSQPTAGSLSLSNMFYPGRCHTSTVMGDKIIFFGGDVRHSNDLVIFDTRTNEINALPKICVDEEGLYIIPRVSAIAVSRGVELFIFGGFNKNYGQLGDLWQIDMAFDLTCTTIDGIRLMPEVDSDSDPGDYDDD